MFKKIFLILCFLLVSTYSTALAMEFNVPQDDSAGGIVTVNKEVKDNFFAAGYQIKTESNINGDAFLFASKITLKEEVSDNAFIAGQGVEIQGKIAHDLFAIAADLSLDKNSQVLGNAYLGAAIVDLAGTIKGNVYVGADSLKISGTIEGDLKAEVDKLTLDSTAQVKGKITYTSKNEAKIVSGATYGAMEKKEKVVQAGGWRDKGFWSGKLYSLLGSLLVGIILLTLVPKYFSAIAEIIKNKPWLSLGWGLLFLIITPVIMVIAMVIIIGFPLAMIAAGLYLLAIYLAKIFAGLTVGNLISKGKWTPIWALTGGMLIIVLLSIVPWIGGLINFVVILAGLGAIFLVTKEALAKK